MNPHMTPRNYPPRPMPHGGGGGGPGGTSISQSRPIPQQTQQTDEYDSIPEEDREHIDEVVSISYVLQSTTIPPKPILNG